jgi:2-amino-4-hydroxy-6-hydroxymethyldihydropteridine diphosphokinase
MKTAFLGLGSNEGDRAANLRRALGLLAEHAEVLCKSRIYESEPMYVVDQPRFYNVAVSVSTGLLPHELLAKAKEIEAALGRKPGTHNLPRPIDIDILLYEHDIIETPELTIPHPRMHERAFVMKPLEEIAPFEWHPVLRRPMIDLWDEVGYQADTLWEPTEQL